MPNCGDILISVEPCYGFRILDGSKTVELRRRPVRVQPGTRMWIYITKPVAGVSAYAVIGAMHELQVTELWRRYGRDARITRSAFREYFQGRKKGYALVIGKVVLLTRTVALGSLRRRLGGFNPPQFFKKLTSESPELQVLRAAI